MRLDRISRTQKSKILADLLNHRPGPLQLFYNNREQDLAKMTDAELIAEHERLRKQQFRETGIMPPPIPDFEAMTDEELNAWSSRYEP